MATDHSGRRWRSQYAVAHPMMPPPTTATSNVAVVSRRVLCQYESVIAPEIAARERRIEIRR
jgi:hypothetical protein